ncbi:MAG TPA: hypothetical protein DCQ28_07290 [Bacteroidetes bacterium]|nr:hypothetical protein [Bacteroidota bacterium]
MGRTAIYMVMALTAMFLFFGKTMNDSGTDALSNAIDYYEHTQVYNIAAAGANLACNQIFLNNTWRTGFSNVVMNGGTFFVSIDSTTDPGKLIILSTGFYQADSHRVKIILNPSSISKFAMYSGNVSAAAKLRSGDTINGPIHFNNKLVTSGNPVFMDKATMGTLQTTAGTPSFLGGYQTGVNITFPSYTASANAIVAAASAAGGTNDYQVGGDMYLRFSVVGGVTKVEYKTNPAAVWGAPVDLATFAPTGNIAMVNGAVHVEGTIKGQVTITSTVNPSTTIPSATVGATYIENNIRYNTDPLITPSSTDMLGLVSAGDIKINTIPIRMDGSFFTNTSTSLGGSLNNTNPAKQLKIVGSLITKDIGPTDFGTGASKGANLYMKYDTRLNDNPPANFPFPSTNSFEVLSWFE